MSHRLTQLRTEAGLARIRYNRTQALADLWRWKEVEHAIERLEAEHGMFP